MKAVPTVGATLALVASIFVLRIVLHGYTHHGYLDVFHLVVGVASVMLAFGFAWRALPQRNG
jgi:hypothetical protein